jgi:hypothetical protein
MRSLVAFSLVLLIPLCAAAQEVPSPPAIPPGEDVITTLFIGGRAPHNGMLLDTDTAIRWTNRLTWWPEAFRLHLAEDVEVAAARDASHQNELRIVQQSLEREIDGLRTNLREAVRRYEGELARFRDPPFYETWAFAFGLGVLVTGIVVGVIGGLLVGL